MGRPLHKKNFGNRNTGGSGEGVASVTINTAGTYTSGLPTVTFDAPLFAGGDTATGIVHGQALSASTTSNGTGYRVGDVLTVAGGTRTIAATFPVASITTLGTPTITNGGTLYDVTDVNDGDKVTFTHANLTTALRVRITAVSGSTATTIVVEQHGVWTGTGAFPTSMADGVGGFTATTTARTGGDTNGNGLILGFTGSNWGVFAFGTVAVQGDYTVMPSNPASFTGGNGSSAAATITFGVKNVEITDAGSGYTTAADALPAFSAGAAAGTSVLTSVSENAIVIYANTSGSGTTGKVGDIVKQVSTRRYKVTTADATGIVRIGTDDTPAPGFGYIVATASGGNTYYVTKLTKNRATLVTKTGDGALNGKSVQWRFTTPTATIVTLENA